MITLKLTYASMVKLISLFVQIVRADCSCNSLHVRCAATPVMLPAECGMGRKRYCHTCDFKAAADNTEICNTR